MSFEEENERIVFKINYAPKGRRGEKTHIANKVNNEIVNL